MIKNAAYAGHEKNNTSINHPNFLYPETVLENNTATIGNKIKNIPIIKIQNANVIRYPLFKNFLKINSSNLL